eukprot:scaffold11580_cov205-Chaetoceros_neogracile.AAC.1
MTSFSNLFENATAVINDDALFGSSDPTTDEPEISMLAQQRITLVITAIPCIVILAICAICCFCPRITNNLDTCISINGGRSDDEYIDAIARRQMEEEEKNRENPVERRKRLENHVSSNNVTMTVTKECFLSNGVNRSDTEDSDEEMQMHSEMSQQVKELDACIAESLFIPDIIHDEEGNGEPLQNGGRK